jgi:hypothetical protein
MWLAFRAECLIIYTAFASPSFQVQRGRRQPENANMHLRIATMAALLAGIQGLAGCAAFAGTTDDQVSQETLWPTKSWQVSTPEEQGMDSASLARLIETVGSY